MPDLTQKEKEALKEAAKIRKLELEFERLMNQGTQPNPFDLKPTESKAKGGRAGYKGGKSVKKMGCAIKGRSKILR